MEGEYYIAYIDEDHIECHYMVHARTPEQALNMFLIRHGQYKPTRIIEWIENKLNSKQKVHRMGDTMNINKWYEDGQKNRGKYQKIKKIFNKWHRH